MAKRLLRQGLKMIGVILLVAIIVLAMNIVASGKRRQRKLIPDEKNAYILWKEISEQPPDLQTCLEMMSRMFEMEGWEPPPDSPPPSYPRFGDCQVLSKVASILAVFRMIEGRREEALGIAAAGVRTGQLMKNSPLLIHRLMGTAAESIALGPLEVYALNCCETEEEFRQLWNMLERLKETEKRFTTDDILEGERDLGPWLPPWLPPLSWENLEEAKTRMDVTTAEFELLRMATAAQYRLITQDRFPAQASEFGPLLPQGPAVDPFSGKPLLWRLTTGSLLCYSVGPNLRHDQAAVSYDPTNGTRSGGDLIVEVPRKRPYPFPRAGTRAASVDDLLRQYPNGFPPDPFATDRPKSLGVAASPNGDIYIFSYGPNVDEYKIQPSPPPVSWPSGGTIVCVTDTRFATGRYALPAPHYLEFQYDPTNGMIGDGDVFIHVPPP